MSNKIRPFRKPIEQKKRIVKFIALFVFTLIILITIWKITSSDFFDISTSRSINKNSITAEEKSEISDFTKLKQKLDTIINKYSNISVSISFIDLESAEIVNIGETKPYTAASITKIITATYFLNQKELGNHSLDEVIEEHNAKWYLQQMLQNSDNNSWTLLNDFLDRQKLSDYAQQIGITTYNAENNTISSADISRLLQKLYNYELLNKNDTNLILTYMQNTKNEDLIPQVLLGTTVYHKYGILDGNLHDAAIVKNNNPYILTIFTNSNDSVDYQEKVKLFHEITQTIQKYTN